MHYKSQMILSIKPTSRLMVLEFSKVTTPGLDGLYDFYSFQIIPPLGKVRGNVFNKLSILYGTVQYGKTCLKLC